MQFSKPPAFRCDIQQISDVVQQSARSSAEVSLAASQLSELSEDLQQIVAKFRL